MKCIVPVAALSLMLAGCASQPLPPPKPDPMVQMLSAVVALGQMAQAGKQAPAIRADTSVLFPSRSQAIAFGLLAFRAEAKAWPATKEELGAFLSKNYKESAPPAGELADLKLDAAPEGAVGFAFVRPGLANERYLLTPDGTISFSLPQKLVPAKGSAPQPTQPNAYSWGDFAARLFVELPLHLLLDAKR